MLCVARFLRRHHNTIVFDRSVKNCESCTPGRRIPSRVRVEERRGGVDVVPACPWVKAAAWRNSRRVQSRGSGGLDGVPPPCWESHLSENKKRKKTPRNNRLDVIPPHNQQFCRSCNLAARNYPAAFMRTPHGGHGGSTPGSPPRHTGVGIGGGRTRNRSLESQLRWRPAENPLQNHPGGAIGTGEVQSFSADAADAAQLAGRGPGRRVGVSDRWESSARSEHDERWGGSHRPGTEGRRLQT